MTNWGLGARKLFFYWACVLFVVSLGTVGCATDPQPEARPEGAFFEKFPLRISDTPAAVYAQTKFFHNSIPAITRLPDGRLFLAWSASIGFARGGRIVGAFSDDGGKTWGEPIELINNPDRDDGDPSIVVHGDRLSVISTSIRLPERFDKFNVWPVTYDRTWWWMTTTEDGGKSWSTPVEVERPFNYAGKRANTHRLGDGTLLLSGYYETQAEESDVPGYERDMHCAAATFRSSDGGRTWTAGEHITISGESGAAEPATVVLSNGDMFCLLRNSSDRLFQTRSRDGGQTWDTPEPSPLPARNAPAWVHRLEDRPGDELVVAWDNDPATGRWPLVVAHSPDGGRTWSEPKLLANPNPEGGYRADYPTICQTEDGTIVIVWQEQTLPRHLGKELRVARFSRAWLLSE